MSDVTTISEETRETLAKIGADLFAGLTGAAQEGSDTIQPPDSEASETVTVGLSLVVDYYQTDETTATVHFTFGDTPKDAELVDEYPLMITDTAAVFSQICEDTGPDFLPAAVVLVYYDRYKDGTIIGSACSVGHFHLANAVVEATAATETATDA